VFVVDSSGSINEHDKGNWDRVKNFAKSIVGKLDIGEDRVRVGMVEFGNEGFVQFYLNSHYNIPDITEDIDRSLNPPPPTHTLLTLASDIHSRLFLPGL